MLQFRTPQAAMETLFGIVNGDEIYATLATLEEEKSGGDWVFWFSRIYIFAYVAIFTIVVINLLIAIFMSSYDSIKVMMYLWWDKNYVWKRETLLTFVLYSYVFIN